MSQLSKPSGIIGIFSAILMNISNRNLYKCVSDNLKPTFSDTILEIGFGNGRLIKLAAQHKCKKICGIDISPDMIAVAKVTNKHYILKNKVELKFGDIKRIPFPNNSFNIIYTVNTLYFWEDINNSLLEINRVLVGDGIFINAYFSSKRFANTFSSELQFRQYDITFLKNEYNKSGLNILKIIERNNDSIICIISQKHSILKK